MIFQVHFLQPSPFCFNQKCSSDIKGGDAFGTSTECLKEKSEEKNIFFFLSSLSSSSDCTLFFPSLSYSLWSIITLINLKSHRLSEKLKRHKTTKKNQFITNSVNQTYTWRISVSSCCSFYTQLISFSSLALFLPFSKVISIKIFFFLLHFTSGTSQHHGKNASSALSICSNR